MMRSVLKTVSDWTYFNILIESRNILFNNNEKVSNFQFRVLDLTTTTTTTTTTTKSTTSTTTKTTTPSSTTSSPSGKFEKP